MLAEATQPLKLALLASFTVDFLKPYLTVEAARRGLELQVWIAPFGQIEQQALDAHSALFSNSPDIVLILPRLEDLAPDLAWSQLRFSSEALLVDRQLLADRLRAVITSIRSRTAAKILCGNFPPPAWCSTGPADAALELSQAGLIQSLSADLAAICAAVPDAAVLDVAAAARAVGTDRWRDDRLAWLAKAPLSHDAMVSLAKATARRLRPWFAPPKKCLVLDMDHTIWGGVLGEAGLDGIQLGPDYPGNVFVDFQRRVLALRDQGILLAAASKNNAADAEQALATHPACLLKREHFSAFEVHWEDKAISLRRIAASLNIGVDSLVFFDDNPAEREWVRSQLPEVTVLEVPTSPMGYGKLLEDCGCFDSLAMTAEDRRRAELYQQERQREALQQDSGSLDEFLRSLEMTVTLGEIDEANLPRVAQLLAKTNQFNLTTRRHSPAEIAQILAQGGVGLTVRVQDRFGDSGLVGVAIARPLSPELWMIDTFLLSCRVIGRSVETAMLAALEQCARSRGAAEMHGEYLPTAKNQPAADFFQRHGYQPVPPADSLWQSSLAVRRSMPDTFAVIDSLSLP